MTALIIDGKARAAMMRAELKSQIADMPVKPGLAFILVGDHPASLIYVSAKEKACAEIGVASHTYRLNTHATQGEVEAQIDALNDNPSVHGILVQMPLPGHLNTDALLARVSATKDVDGLHPYNLGHLFAGKPGLTPCTPQGVMVLLRDLQPDLTGLHAVVIGRSVLVGRPMAQMLLQANCTVTQAHSKTRNLPDIVRGADIIVAAAGVAKMVKGDWVKPGAIVIDVGMNRDAHKKLCGDVDFDAVKNIARAITPVPGGVGPMTIACLLNNTLKAGKDR
jgi:methylenetetrahydrofolate dehydrogenase (NADP+) / methenyltetrahydrofolate cyclohydrolase